MLKLENLTKRYNTGDLALQGIDLSIPNGQVLALIGPSGAGKSTLIRCINRLVEPTNGSAILNEVNLTKLSSRALRKSRRKMGMIFQEYALVERLTVMENVLSGRLGYVGFWKSFLRRFPKKDVNEAFRLLDRVGLLEMADKRADELSGGQRQRVGICRALIQDPDLLLVDEPTASLDPDIGDFVRSYIQEYKKKNEVTILLASHNMDEVERLCDSIIMMKKGRIIDRGTCKEIIKKHGRNNLEETFLKLARSRDEL